eukprot:2491912-Pyramimonas_sp.AAC.1
MRHGGIGARRHPNVSWCLDVTLFLVRGLASQGFSSVRGRGAKGVSCLPISLGYSLRPMGEEP